MCSGDLVTYILSIFKLGKILRAKCTFHIYMVFCAFQHREAIYYFITADIYKPLGTV